MQSHANNDQLVQFRDKALLDASIKQHIETCSVCLADLAELQVLSASLSASDIPQLSLEEFDRSWEVIASSFKAESKTYTRRYWVAAAASVAVAFFMATQNFETESPKQEFVELSSQNKVKNNVASETYDSKGEVQLNQLLAYSRILENRLQAMPQPRVVRASTAGTITHLEDQISMLDTRLSMQTQAPLSSQQRNVLWQQRVNSMNNLYRVRAAQLQRVSY